MKVLKIGAIVALVILNLNFGWSFLYQVVHFDLIPAFVNALLMGATAMAAGWIGISMREKNTH